MRVLIVDDSRITRRIIVNALKQIGHDDVLEAGDGVEALERVAQGTPDLVVTDWSMPVMDGHDFVKALRAQPHMRTVPVLMVTARAERSDVVLALQAGVNDYIVKPFTAETLKEKIETLMSKTAVTPA